MDRNYLFVLLAVLHLARTKAIANYADTKNTITEDDRRGSEATHYKKGELDQSETKLQIYAGTGAGKRNPSTRHLFYLPSTEYESQGYGTSALGPTGIGHSSGSVVGSHGSGYSVGHGGSFSGGVTGGYSSHGSNNVHNAGSHGYGSDAGGVRYGGSHGGGYDETHGGGQSSYPSGHGSYPSSHGSYPSDHGSYPSVHGSYPSDIGSYPSAHGSFPTDHGNSFPSAGGHNGHGVSNNLLHKGLALKGILIPLAGIALLGAAAALSTNPVLLQLGVLQGRRRRRAALDMYPPNTHVKPKLK